MPAFKLTRRSYNNDLPDVVTESDYIRDDPDKPDDPTVIGSFDHISSHSHNNMSGFDIKNFHQLKRKGVLLPHTPFRKYQATGEATGDFDVLIDLTTRVGHYYASNGFAPCHDWLPTTSTTRSGLEGINLNALVQAAAAKIYSNGHDTLTFLAEIHHVRRMFKDALLRLIKLDFPRNWKSLSNDWLAARYGWRILLYDMQEISEVMKSLDFERKRYSEKVGLSHSTSWSEESVFSHSHFDMRYTTLHSVSVSARGSVVADIEPAKWRFNLPATAWELVTLSFVVDWFINVGQAINAMSFLAFSSDYSASQGFYLVHERSLSSQMENLQKTGKFVSGDVWQTGYSISEFESRVPTSVSSIPQFNVRLSDLKILDLLALLYQRIS
jgi:hypothetical protein